MNSIVSIIIPVHNRQDYIVDTLKSIHNQTYKKLEVLLVDDHSTDKTCTIIKEFVSSNTGEIQYYLFESDGYGSNHARNYGLKRCTGDYIQFFDDDDVMCPDYISKRLEPLITKHLDWVGCDFVHFEGNENNVILDRGISAIPHNIRSHIYHLDLPTQCFLLTRHAVEVIGCWDERVKRMQDMAYFHRLFLFELKGEWIYDHLFKYRVHKNSITTNQRSDTRIYAFRVIADEWKAKGRYNEVKDALSIGIYYFWRGSIRESIGLFLNLFYQNADTLLPILFKKLVLLKTNKDILGDV